LIAAFVLRGDIVGGRLDWNGMAYRGILLQKESERFGRGEEIWGI
jgi:hypothetical protein